jgi:hypothetical protein
MRQKRLAGGRQIGLGWQSISPLFSVGWSVKLGSFGIFGFWLRRRPFSPAGSAIHLSLTRNSQPRGDSVRFR